jgi:tetratricopeptide (TPR) repeat protein
MDKFFDFIEKLKKYWPTPIGLIGATLFALSIETPLLLPLTLSKINYIICYIVTTSLITFIWFIYKRTPKTKKNKIGFVVSIICSNEDEGKKIHEDFTLTLQSLIKNSPSGKDFHFIEIKQHIAQKILNFEDAFKLQKKTRAHFVIFGRVRKRLINNSNTYFLELEGIVLHGPISIKDHSKLSGEFSELFPRQLAIDEKNDLFSFNFASEWTEYVAKYIIGIAAFLSRDLDYSEILFTDIKQKLLITNPNIKVPFLEKIKTRLPQRFYDIYLSKALFHLSEWRKNHDLSYLPHIIDSLNKIDKKFENEYAFVLIKAIVIFLDERDVLKAKSCIRKCFHIKGAIQNVTWRFSLAFLEAYDGNLKKSVQQYQKCEKFVNIDPKVIDEVEDFICWVLEKEPEKYQLYFCLGFINKQIKEDKIQALNDFEKFLRLAKIDQFIKEQELAKQWIRELESEIKNEKYFNEL